MEAQMFSVALSSFTVRGCYVHLPAEVRVNYTGRLFDPYKILVGPMNHSDWKRFHSGLVNFLDRLTRGIEDMDMVPRVMNDLMHVEVSLGEHPKKRTPHVPKSKSAKSFALMIPNQYPLQPYFHEAVCAVHEKSSDESEDSIPGDGGSPSESQCRHDHQPIDILGLCRDPE